MYLSFGNLDGAFEIFKNLRQMYFCSYVYVAGFCSISIVKVK